MGYEYQQNYNSTSVMPDDNKTIAIVALALSILCCCSLPGIGFSIYAITQANEVEKAMNQGFPLKAQQASKNAKLFSWIAIGLTVVQSFFTFVYIILVILSEM
ncbi:MAG: CD225/dispanin family protein [Prevotella sp.]|nr:CD225/dispanin family protein [Prevotella sp.]